MAGAANWRLSGALKARVKLRDAMFKSCGYQGYLKNQCCQERPQCAYYCSFLTGQNILAGLSASASEIGLVLNFRARAWHCTFERLGKVRLVPAETPQDRCLQLLQLQKIIFLHSNFGASGAGLDNQ